MGYPWLNNFRQKQINFNEYVFANQENKFTKFVSAKINPQ